MAAPGTSRDELAQRFLERLAAMQKAVREATQTEPHFEGAALLADSIRTGFEAVTQNGTKVPAAARAELAVVLDEGHAEPPIRCSVCGPAP